MPLALSPRAFWFLRHGQTDWNINSLAQGRTDVPLNERGLAQARDAALLLQGRSITGIVSSPLSRARATAEIVGAALGISVDIDPDLQEVAFGEREGQAMLAPWFTDWVTGVCTPKGAESFAEVRDRAVMAVNTILAEHQAAPGLTLIVGHGGMFRGLRAAMGLAPDVRLPNGVPLLCRPRSPWDLQPAD